MKKSKAYIGKDGFKRIPYETDQNNPTIKDYVKAVEKGMPQEFKSSIFTHEQLLEALYWMFDAFERSSIGFVLIYSTAESVLAKKLLEGDRIELGVRRLEWESGSKTIFDTYIQDEAIEIEEMDKKVRYIVNGVPVEVYILEDDPSISSPDTLLYENESFHLPNTYARFLEVYPK